MDEPIKNAVHRRQNARTVASGFFLFVAGAIAAAARADQPATVPVIQWLPAASHNAILQAREQLPTKPDVFQFDMWDLMADEEALNAKLKVLQKNKPPVVVVFGDYVSGRIARQCPNVAQISLLNSMAQTLPNVTCISCEPDASIVWQTARSLRPALRRLAILFTDGYPSSLKLAEELEQSAEKEEKVVRSTVPRGMCRTDSDFRKAVESLVQNGGCDLLYVPDDPNTSRFAVTIRDEARKAGIPVIGNEAMAGKGCVAAIVRDLDEIGKLLCKTISDHLRGQEVSSRVLYVPMKIKVDEALLKSYPGLQATGKQ